MKTINDESVLSGRGFDDKAKVHVEKVAAEFVGGSLDVLLPFMASASRRVERRMRPRGRYTSQNAEQLCNYPASTPCPMSGEVRRKAVMAAEEFTIEELDRTSSRVTPMR